MTPHCRHRITRLAGTVATAILVTLLVGSSAPAAAGGWAVGSLDSIPEPTAGETVEVGFTILQHGVTPADLADDVGIEIFDPDGTVDFFAAERGDAIGHYTASVTFPATSGDYEWSMRMGWFGPQQLGTLSVAADSVSATTTARWLAVRWVMVAVVTVFGAVAVSSLAASRGRTRPAHDGATEHQLLR